MTCGWYMTKEGLDTTRIQIGDRFYFEGDWQVPEGRYEVVDIHTESPMQIDARYIEKPEEELQARIYEGFWPKTVIQGKALVRTTQN